MITKVKLELKLKEQTAHNYLYLKNCTSIQSLTLSKLCLHFSIVFNFTKPLKTKPFLLSWQLLQMAMYTTAFWAQQTSALHFINRIKRIQQYFFSTITTMQRNTKRFKNYYETINPTTISADENGDNTIQIALGLITWWQWMHNSSLCMLCISIKICVATRIFLQFCGFILNKMWLFFKLNHLLLFNFGSSFRLKSLKKK